MSGHSHHARDARIERLEAELEELRAAGDKLQSAHERKGLKPCGVEGCEIAHPETEQTEARVQACPVCGGRGWVPFNFYGDNSMSTGAQSHERCRTCGGATTIALQPAQSPSEGEACSDEQNPNQRKELLEMETQDAITIAYHRNNERGFRDALALTPRAERTTKDSQAAYDLGYEEGRKVRQSLVYNIQEAPNDR